MTIEDIADPLPMGFLYREIEGHPAESVAEGAVS